MSDYSALEKLAYNATPGPWTAYDTHGKRFIERVGTEDHVVCDTPKRQWLRDSEYIAAANPVVVLGLVEENRSAQSQLAALREELAKFDEGMRALACSLGAGGYNAETLTADQLVDKVQWGIDNIITVQEQRLADAERRNADYEFSLMYLRSQIDNSVLVAYIDAALNKPEEAKS